MIAQQVQERRFVGGGLVDDVVGNNNAGIYRHGDEEVEYDEEEEEEETETGEEDDDDTSERSLGEEDRALDAVLLAQPSPVLGMDDPLRMHLTNQERQWALAIKDAIEKSPEVDNLTDYMYCQLALIEKSNLEGAVDRAIHFQHFYEQYGLQGTKHDGVRKIREMIRMFPKYVLSCSFSAADGHYIIVYDSKGFNIKALDTPQKFNTWFGAVYYMMHCMCPDFESIRKGTVLIAECEGYDWTKNVDQKTFQKFWSELAVMYPVYWRKLKHFHTGLLFNLLFSMSKRLLPEEVLRIVEVGCQFDGRLDEVYLTPTVGEANRRILARFEDLLQRRYHNEATFTL